ncbi:hypothetical protein cypCar_00011783 [Cyprinus carpio]|nr:hypothetical protein cypCar_00011783 [Cyprinus carpio]
MIGGGPAGLCAARHILSRPEAFDPPVVYEMTDHLGGTWFYEEQVGTYENGYPIHSSMYRDFRTNLAKEIMMFPDFPFDDHLPSFLHHKSVQQYLEKYCEKHDIAHYIKFNTVVEKVKPVSMEMETGGAVTWEVISCSTCGDRNTQTLGVCLQRAEFSLRHYSDPHLPYIPGIEHFKGKVLHSHSYRYPEPFTNKSVVVLGARASGVDISIEIAQVKAQVKFSLAVLEGSAELPTQEEMEKEVQREMQRKQDTGVQVKNLLNLDKDQREYYLDMAKVGRFTAPQSVFESLYEEVRGQRQKEPQKYRQINYMLIDATQWEILEAPPEQTD